jgi:predicted chitinase
MLTLNQLKTIAPLSKANDAFNYIPHFNTYMPLSGIDSVPRKAAFLAQLLHESGSLRFQEEIASGKAYEGRRDLGNIFPGDGMKFKGRGPIQITGRINYTRLSQDLFGDLRLLDHPEEVATYDTGTRAACWYWDTRKLNIIADKPDDWRIEVRKNVFFDRFEYITYKINGGLNGYVDRLQFYRKALQVLRTAVAV